MGQHAPLDGFITYNELQNRYKFNINNPNSNIVAEIIDMKTICNGINMITNDPLGIGGLLSDSYRIVQLLISGELNYPELLKRVLNSVSTSLKLYVAENHLTYPSDYRLAFRELGLSIGLKGLKKVMECLKENQFFAKSSFYHQFKPLNEYLYLGNSIEEFWKDKKNRKNTVWRDHNDINTVMLATTIIPEGFLKL